MTKKEVGVRLTHSRFRECVSLTPTSPTLTPCSKRGALLVEVVLSVAIFALAMVTMAMMFFAILSGSNSELARPLAERILIEDFCRTMDEDFNSYRPIFAYTNQFHTNTDAWITPGPIVLDPGLRLQDITQDNFRYQTVPDAALVSNAATNKSYTMIFLGSESVLTNASANYVVYPEVVYHLIVKDDPIGTTNRIAYHIRRFQRTTNGPSQSAGISHDIIFYADGFSMTGTNDQSQPEFYYLGSNVIRAQVPNPLSGRVKDTAGGGQTFTYILPLIYRLNTQGVQ
ncbi:MAG: type IV pilus modification PilV family protein [Verrucomicrobiota bacterium]